MSSIPGSFHIPLGQLRQRMSELPKDRLIDHVRLGVRSYNAARILMVEWFFRYVRCWKEEQVFISLCIIKTASHLPAEEQTKRVVVDKSRLATLPTARSALMSGNTSRFWKVH